jgi:hypothetical protein
MISNRAVALAGALFLLSSAPTAFAAQGCGPDSDQIVSVPWPQECGGVPTKMAAGALFEPNGMQLLVLSDGVLSMVRDPLSAPRAIVLAESVIDFVVLPTVGGVSRVAFVSEAGLHLSSIVSGGDSQGLTLGFSLLETDAEWGAVTLLDAAADGSNVQIVGARGATVLRGKLSDNGDFEAGVTLELGFTVTHLAAADAHSNSGVEVAAGDAYSLGFYFEDSSGESYVTPIVSTVGFVQVARIPNGADVRDSLAVIDRTSTSDILRELVEGTFSDPIGSGGLQVSHAAYHPVGIAAVSPFAVGPTDMLFASTGGDFMALHGIPQVGVYAPFAFDMSRWALLDLETPLGEAPLTSVFALADFDSDGDGDLAVFVEGGDGNFIAFVENHCEIDSATASVLAVNPETSPYSSGGTSSFNSSDELGVDLTLEVRQPPVFDGEIPTHVQVKIYVREYYSYSSPPYPIQPDVLPDVWWEDILVVTPGTTTPEVTPHTAVLQFEPLLLPMSAEPEQLNSDNTILYFELIPQRRTGTGSGAQSGELIQRGNPTIWVGSANEDLMRQLICNQEPDEFSEGYCNNTGPHVTYVHRHKVIRYIPPQTNPQ